MGTDFTELGMLLGNRARSTMIGELLRGGSMSASELASAAGIASSTASEHLSALCRGRILDVRVQGRLRLYAISRPEVAEALEALARICPTPPVTSLRHAIANRRLALARTCYDHLAGKVGVGLHDALVSKRWLRVDGRDYTLTASGSRRLDEIGVDLESTLRAHRIFARACLDWTERRPHLAGALGAAITTAMFDRGWLRRRATGGRSVDITPAGRAGLSALGVDVAQAGTLGAWKPHV